MTETDLLSMAGLFEMTGIRSAQNRANAASAKVAALQLQAQKEQLDAQRKIQILTAIQTGILLRDEEHRGLQRELKQAVFTLKKMVGEALSVRDCTERYVLLSVVEQEVSSISINEIDELSEKQIADDITANCRVSIRQTWEELDPYQREEILFVRRLPDVLKELANDVRSGANLVELAEREPSALRAQHINSQSAARLERLRSQLCKTEQNVVVVTSRLEALKRRPPPNSTALSVLASLGVVLWIAGFASLGACAFQLHLLRGYLHFVCGAVFVAAAVIAVIFHNLNVPKRVEAGARRITAMDGRIQKFR
ncbi:MAG TPA: hypothetical protein VFJ58_20335, partial [Armatimonadota bacterium]|nr:hypothetical protein [Armatimonadota bacterium]